MRKLAAWLVIALLVRPSYGQQISTNATVKQASVHKAGANVGGADYYFDLIEKNKLLGFDTTFEKTMGKQEFQIQADSPILSQTQIQSNLNNLGYDQAPVNFFGANAATLTFVSGTAANLGVSRTIIASTQAEQTFSGALTGLTGSGTITATFNLTAGSLPSVGTVIGVAIAGVTGAAGTLNGIYSATVASANSLTYISNGANASGAAITSATASAGQGVMYTLASALPAIPVAGDIFQISWNNYNPIPSYATASGGAVLSLETSDVCTASQTVDPINGGTGAGCGVQSLKCDTTGGGSCNINYVVDNTSVGNFLYLNNSSMLTQWMSKAVSGSPNVSVNIHRTGSGAWSYALNPALTSTWTQESDTRALTDVSTTAVLGEVMINITLGGTGVQEFDNFWWGDAKKDVSNTSVFSDAVFHDFKSKGAGALRFWRGGGQNSQTMANYITPELAQTLAVAGIGPAYQIGDYGYSLHDFLVLNQLTGSIPHFLIPAGFSKADAQNLVDYLFGGSSTVFGAQRIALGGPSGGWGSVFPVMLAAFMNETWNTKTLGQALGFRSGEVFNGQDYANYAAPLFAAMRAQPSYIPGKLILLANIQTADPADTPSILSTATADGGEINDYYGFNVDTITPTASLYGPTMLENYANQHATNSSSGFNQQWATGPVCGATKNAKCTIVVYEENMSAEQTACNQTCSDTLNQAAVGALTEFDQVLGNIDAGLQYQSLFTESQYFESENGANRHIWGINAMVGGQATAFNAATTGDSDALTRPTGWGMYLANQCAIGPELTTVGTNIPTLSLTTATNGVNPISGVPAVRSYLFNSGNTYCLALDNLDPMNSHAVTFTNNGTTDPGTSVTLTTIAAPSLASTNEAPDLTSTAGFVATVYPKTTAGFNPQAGLTLAPGQVAIMTYTAGSAVAPPSPPPTPPLPPPAITPSSGILLNGAGAIGSGVWQ